MKNTTLKKTIREFQTLKDLREKVNLDVCDVSEFLNVEHYNVESYEKGEGEINIYQAELLAELYGVTIHDIIEAQLASKVRHAIGD